MEERNAQETTFEEELKALKAKWADKKAEARAEAKKAEEAESRKLATAVVEEALKVLNSLPARYQRELKPVYIRLQMFKNGERYTRNKGE